MVTGETMGVSMDQKKDGGGEETDIVPTVDVIRFSFLTSLLLLNKHPVLITGKSFFNMYLLFIIGLIFVLEIQILV